MHRPTTQQTVQSARATWRSWALAMTWCLAVGTDGLRAQETAGSPAAEAPSIDDVLEAGQALWDAYAPDSLKEQYEFPSRESVEEFLAALQQALSEGNFEQLAAYHVDARRALALLGTFEGGDELAAWLEPRLDLLGAAEMTLAPRAPERGRAAEAPPASPLARPYWDRVVVARQVPAQAGVLVPRLKKIFEAEGIPPEWVWIAEVESSLNPKARSPVGARGLFQFMPATAEQFGLRTSWPDERTDPEKSARAAARYLGELHAQFKSWPLALAAYNAGQGRVSRTMKSTRTSSFPAVAPHLPAETRLYVPKVLATVARREGVEDPASLPAPRG